MHPRRSPRSPLVIRSFLALCLLGAAPAVAQQAAPPSTTPAEAAKPAPASLPEAKDIIAKAIEVIGGKDAWAKRTSMEMAGTIELPAQGMKGKMVSRTGQPNRMVTEMELVGLGAFRTGFDGKVGWSSDKIQGTRLMVGKELETIAREADYLKDVDPMARWDSIATVGEGAFGGFDCWKLEAKRTTKAADGKESASKATMWYEKSTHLLRGYETVVETSIGALPMSTTFVEYKDFDGIKLPVRTEATQAGQKIITVFEKITFDSVPADAFALPKEVQALLEPEPADDEDDTEAAPTVGGKPAEAPAKP
jgi:hypothetical protein